MWGCGKKFVRMTKFLLAGVAVICVSWMACVSEWRAEEAPRPEQGSTMRTIVGYSERKLAELERPSPVTCDRLPKYPPLQHFNNTWDSDGSPPSWQEVAGVKVKLYAAYYDERAPQRYIRILAFFEGRNFPTYEPLFCQTRAMNIYEETVEVVAAKPVEIWWSEWDQSSIGVETPLLLSCPLTEPLNEPSIVSIVTQPCDDPINAFNLNPGTEEPHYERTATICVKDMNFEPDVSQTLLEWIETNKILGVQMIDIYVDNLNKDSQDVLLHYRDKGYVRLFHVPIKNKPGRSLWQRRRDHIITYNDCLYRNIRESEYIIPLDIDEIVLPKKAGTLPELLARLTDYGWDSTQKSAILVRNVFFFDFLQGIDKYKHKRTYNNKSKMYIKRDDVRIQKTEYLDIGEIELVGDILSNEVIDLSDMDSEIYEEYKTRCQVELHEPKLARHIVSSAVVSPAGFYSKSLMVTKKVLTAFNHYPLASLGSTGLGVWSAPFSEVQLNHYKESCNRTMVAECARYGRRARIDRAAHRLRKPLRRALANTICSKTNKINHF